MAAIRQTLGLFWTSNSGQARGDIGRVSGSFLNMGRSMGSAGRQSTLMNSQMRALGTTLKYMFSGAIVYGSMNAVRNLAQFQKQLGLIAAIGGSAGFIKTSKDLGDLKNQLYGISTDTITPLNETTDAVINLLSSVQAGQGLAKGEIADAVTTIGKAATLSQTPVEDMTKGILALNQAFARPQSYKNISDVAAKWYELISAVPGGRAASPQLIGQLGALAGGARFAHITPGQMFAMTAAGLRFGIPPAQVGQGFAYLFRSIATPEAPGTVKSARQMFAQLGITNDFVQQQGGLQAILKIFREAKRTGIRGNFRRAAQQALAGQNDPNYDPDSVAGLGLSGQGINVLATVFRRQHALRSAIALYSMWQSGQFDKDLRLLGDSMNSVQQQQHDFAQRWRDFAKQSGLAQAGIALGNMQQQITQALAPVFNFAARPITGLERTMARHPDATKYTTYGAAAVLGALGLNKVLGGRLFGNLPFANRFFGMAGQSALMVKAAEDAAKGAANDQAGLSPQHPLYVVLVEDLLGAGRGGGGGGTTPPGVISTAEKDVKNIGRLPWFLGMPLKTALFRGGLAAIAGYGLGKLQNTFGDYRPFGSGPKPPSHMLNIGHFSFDPKRRKWYENKGGLLAFAGGDTNLTKEEQYIAKKLGIAFQGIQRLEQISNSPNLQRILKENNHALVNAIKETGQGGLTLDLTIQEDGKTKSHQRIHIDPSTFTGGKTPGTRGRKKVMKTTGHR